MIKIIYDFNVPTDSDGAFVLNTRYTPREALAPGTRVVLHDPHQVVCEAIVRCDGTGRWVADMVPDTMMTLPDPPEPRAPDDPAYARPMTMIAVDFAKRDYDGSVVLLEQTPADVLVPGRRVIIYQPDHWISEAEVRKGQDCDWAAANVLGRTTPWFGDRQGPPSGRAFLERVGFSEEQTERIYGGRSADE